MTPVPLPLLAPAALDTPIAWRHGQAVSRIAFLRHVARIARCLPPARFILNLCEDRYRFLAAFAAVGANGQTNLLPSSRASLHLQRLAEDYPDSGRIADDDIESWLVSDVLDQAVPAIPELPAEQVMAIAFTSGSTGRAKPNPKTWGELVSGARQARRRFGFAAGATVVATVPPQHMYGLETSIMTALASGVSVHGGRPFFPDDVRAALAAVPAPRVLVTTPVHLRACVRAGLRWPRPAFLISATAPLSAALAAQAEATFAAPVLEIYGCTEAGSIASRRTLDGDRWRLYDGFQLRDGWLSGAHLPKSVLLNDIVESCGETEFKLLGRREDLVNIAGKRTSLSDLNHQLNEIDGVAEGVFVTPDEAETEVQRLLAVVVAPGLSERQLLTALAQRFDPAFLPRPLIKVDALPRNDTGKVTRESLLALVARLHPSASSSHES
jgi:acyl-coenzyme A synthetase/AMP-(fatty) acid ligase